VFKVLPEALDKATGGGRLPVSARTLYYQVRPLLQAYTHRALDYKYFSQTLLTEYRDLGQALEGLYYDPRGVLYEPHVPPPAAQAPHTGRTVALSTQSVDAYTIPAWLYNKILYVEKKGLMPVLEAAQLGDRYDMAIIAAEGYATEATRVLLERAEGCCQLFVLHDADPDGYNIARTLREETARMPGYAVDVIDLGLTVDAAVEMGLEAETFTRERELPWALATDLTATEQEYFEGTRVGRKHWIAQRVELNAMTGPQLVAYIERRLEEVGAVGKVIPDEEALPELAEEVYQQQIGTAVEAAVRDMLSLDALHHQVAEAMRAHVDVAAAQYMIAEALTKDDTQSWHGALNRALGDCLDEHAGPLVDIVRAQVRAMLQRNPG
jgi:hypothetical protein